MKSAIVFNEQQRSHIVFDFATQFLLGFPVFRFCKQKKGISGEKKHS